MVRLIMMRLFNGRELEVRLVQICRELCGELMYAVRQQRWVRRPTGLMAQTEV
jgi:hypothetical protein